MTILSVPLVDLVNRLCDRGIEAVERDYADREDKKRGAMAGFEACRNKTEDELRSLLVLARQETHDAFNTESPNYWEIRCFEAEVEWICNCVSVLLLMSGEPVIVTPTARAGIAIFDVAEPWLQEAMRTNRELPE